MSDQPEPKCPSCQWPLSRHITPCPPELPLVEVEQPAPVCMFPTGRELTTGEPWPTV
jgi:hypothetical protein